MWLLPCTGVPVLASSDAIIYINTTKRIFVQTEVSNITQFQFQSCPCFYCPTFQTQLYFNGYPLSDSRVSYIIQSGTITLNISNATSNDIGVYEILVTFCDGFPIFFACVPFYFSQVFYESLYAIETFTVNIYGREYRVLFAFMFIVPHTSSTSGLSTSFTTPPRSAYHFHHCHHLCSTQWYSRCPQHHPDEEWVSVGDHSWREQPDILSDMEWSGSVCVCGGQPLLHTAGVSCTQGIRYVSQELHDLHAQQVNEYSLSLWTYMLLS